VYYNKGKIQPAGYPVALGYHNQATLTPNKSHLKAIDIHQEEKYLVFRPGKKYSLYYWDNKWIKAGEKVSGDQTISLVFEKVPSNALYLLRPEYSQGMERPFMITNEGKRVWW
jgi:predicted glycosyltransferase